MWSHRLNFVHNNSFLKVQREKKGKEWGFNPTSKREEYGYMVKYDEIHSKFGRKVGLMIIDQISMNYYASWCEKQLMHA